MLNVCLHNLFVSSPLLLPYLLVNDLSDFCKGQAFEYFHFYKQAYGNSL